MDDKMFINRELSWLSFNYRVFEEAKDKSLPLYERIKFLAIYSSNLDEFYKVRVASIRNLVALSSEHKKKLKYNPDEILSKITQEVIKQQKEYSEVFNNDIIPSLASNSIILYQNEELEQVHTDFLNKYFFNEVMPFIQPILLAEGAVHSFLQDNTIYLAIQLLRRGKFGRESKKRKPSYALLRIPSKEVPRFVELPKYKGKHLIMFLDDVLRFNMDKIFPGYIFDSAYCIKLSRDADLAIDDEFSGNLVEKIKRSISKRKTGAPSRFLFDRSIPADFLDFLKVIFNISKKDFYPGMKYHNFADFWKFPNPFKPFLESEKLLPLPHPMLEKSSSIFSTIRDNDVMLHFPYHSYDYVLRFLNEAAVDPKVEEIKTTQYRVAADSAVVRSLITAAMNGKKVTVFVEVKARFDEENNLHFAEMMQKAGINVIASLPGLKVHSKAALVIRKSSSKISKQRGFAFLSTGNFNEKTAQIYADHGLFTTNEVIIDELKNLFLNLEHPVDYLQFKSLLVPRFNFMPEFLKRVDREIDNVKKKKKGWIILKMNGLEEDEVINKLYEASLAGVKIDLIIRGICCLMPNKSFSKNIKVTRIVDQFLEHARVFIFYNKGEYETFLSSADLMNRNLHRRIETAFPIYKENIKNEILDIIKLQLSDNVKACILDDKMTNIRVMPKENQPLIRSQIETYKYLENKKIENYLEVKNK